MGFSSSQPDTAAEGESEDLLNKKYDLRGGEGRPKFVKEKNLRKKKTRTEGVVPREADAKYPEACREGLGGVSKGRSRSGGERGNRHKRGETSLWAEGKGLEKGPTNASRIAIGDLRVNPY